MLLKKGSTGNDVKLLQQKLGLVADGQFGPGTEAKVKEWQTTNGLFADGIVGDATWSKLFPSSQGQSVLENVSGAAVFQLDQLRGHVPDSVIAQIPDTARRFNITNVLRLAHFLAQCAHESGGFSVVFENLNYSAKGLVRVFGRYFPGNLSESYARQPERIASRVYANRMGNGAEGSGEGYKFRGRGYIQLTGKDNYARFSQFIGADCVANPDLVATHYPLASAAFFFNSNGLWAICDRGATMEVVDAVTRRVNGGTNGQEDRREKFTKFYTLLSAV